jgi:hypothetical protein
VSDPAAKLASITAGALAATLTDDELVELRRGLADGTATVAARSDGRFVEVSVAGRRVLVVSVDDLLRTPRLDA